MKLRLRSALILASFAVAALWLAPQAPTLADDEDQIPKVHVLLTQRRDTLRTLVKLVGERFRAGQVNFDVVIRASDQLLNLELELAEGQDARLAIRKQRVELMRDFEKVADARFRAGQATQEDVLTAQAERLGAEIELLKERKVNP